MSEVRQRRQQGDEASAQGVARGISRDLDAARQAYAAGDPDASRRAHASASAASNVGATEGGHATASIDAASATRQDVDRALTSGLSIAILITSGLNFCGADPASLIIPSTSIVAIAGGLLWWWLHIINDRVDHLVFQRERKREAWELSNFVDGEVEEMVELFESRGMALQDAKDVIQKMAKYPSFFVDVMMTEELGLIKPIPLSEAPYRFILAGAAFALGGLVPVVVSASVCSAMGSPSTYPFAAVASGILLLGYVGERKASHSQLPRLGLIIPHIGVGLGCVLVPLVLVAILRRSFSTAKVL